MEHDTVVVTYPHFLCNSIYIYTVQCTLYRFMIQVDFATTKQLIGLVSSLC